MKQPLTTMSTSDCTKQERKKEIKVFISEFVNISTKKRKQSICLSQCLLVLVLEKVFVSKNSTDC